MGFLGFGKKKEENIREEKRLFLGLTKHMCGLDNYGENEIIILSVNDFTGCLEMYKGKNKDKLTCLKYEQITNVEALTGSEVIEKNKSSIGRAVTGGLVLGPLGAIVGGISGVGKKEKKMQKNYLIINYKSSEGEIKSISFSADNVDIWYYNNAKKILLKRVDIKESEPTYL